MLKITKVIKERKNKIIMKEQDTYKKDRENWKRMKYNF